MLKFLTIAMFLFGATTAHCAIAEFFWTGFKVAAPSIPQDEREELEQLFYNEFDQEFRRPQTGAIDSLLSQLELDEYKYYATSAERDQVNENLFDAFGVFFSVNEVIRYRPVTRIKKSDTTYPVAIFGSLNLYEADTRTLVYAQPVFFFDESRTPVGNTELIRAVVGDYIQARKDPNNKFTKRIIENIQKFLGPKGQSYTAIRRTQESIHPIPNVARFTYGLTPFCEKCLDVTDKTNRTPINQELFKSFVRLYYGNKMSADIRMGFPSELADIVADGTGNIASASKEGDVQREYADACDGIVGKAIGVPQYTETGQSIICVRLPEPDGKISIGIRAMVEQSTQNGMPIINTSMRGFFKTEIGDQTIRSDISISNPTIYTGKGEVSDFVYSDALTKMVNNFLDTNQVVGNVKK